MRHIRDAFLLLLMSNLALMASAACITATFYTSIFLSIALVAASLTFTLISIALLILSILSARIGVQSIKGGAA